MKKSVCIIFGGKSEEYEVSLRSAYSVLENIDTDKYIITKIGITRDGKWFKFLGDNEEILKDCWQEHTEPIRIDFSTGCVDNLGKINVIFPVMHGTFCEDGRLQGIFESLNIKIVGCDSFSSFLCMDKHLCKLLAKGEGINVANGICINKHQMRDFYSILKDTNKIGFPVFVKPALSGSSRGACKVDKADNLYRALKEAFLYSNKVLIEEYIDGVECEIGALELPNGEVIFSEVGSLSYDSEFYDYNTKYINEDTKYQIPAPLSDSVTDKIKESARKLFCLFGCSGLSRLDFFVASDGEVYFNEINTLPGFTSISMYPMLFKELGYSFGEIIDILLNL